MLLPAAVFQLLLVSDVKVRGDCQADVNDVKAGRRVAVILRMLLGRLFRNKAWANLVGCILRMILAIVVMRENKDVLCCCMYVWVETQ